MNKKSFKIKFTFLNEKGEKTLLANQYQRKAERWLKKAKTVNAIVTISYTGRVTWKNGVWEDGTWYDGTWENGDWYKGTWYKGTWYDGTWVNGTWHDGTWENGRWIKGKWESGTWNKGRWYDGIWKNGTWENGVWGNGTWFNGTWKDGTWYKGTWEKGIWVNGIWVNGIWENGIWENGIWNSGIWENGKWKCKNYHRITYMLSLLNIIPDSEGNFTAYRVTNSNGTGKYNRKFVQKPGPFSEEVIENLHNDAKTCTKGIHCTSFGNAYKYFGIDNTDKIWKVTFKLEDIAGFDGEKIRLKSGTCEETKFHFLIKENHENNTPNT